MVKNDILKQEYSKKFDEIRKNAVLQSFFKYGPASKNFGQQMVDARACAEKCVEKYNETHNTEYLADAANYLMFEYMYPSYKDAYFKRTNSDESAGVVGLTWNEMKEYQK